mgnify:CR=1 FL=1
MQEIPFNKLFNIHACKGLIESKRSMKQDTAKVAIIGSRSYEHKEKIREMIWMLKNKLGKVEIVSGGATHGADKYAKKYAIELGVGYVEFNPAHTVKNLYSAMPEDYYSKEYHVSQLFHRNELIAAYCDRMIAFRSTGKSSGTDHAIKMAEKYNKPYIIIGDKV